MDLLLENGDFKRNSSGRPIQISGLDELKQRIYIRLKARLGGFIYDRKLGSEITADVQNNQLTELIRKSLPELFDVDLVSASMDNGNLKVNFNSQFGEFTLKIQY